MSAVARVLLVMPNWLGDVVMTLPALATLASAGAEVHVAVRRRWRSLLADDPRIASLIVHERGEDDAPTRLAARWRRLRPAGVLLGPPSLRVAAAAALARIPVRVGHRADLRARLLTHAVPLERPRGMVHYADQMDRLARELLRALALPPDLPAPGWPRAAAFDGTAAADLDDGPPAWVLGVGTTFGPAKTWPAARMAEFARLAAAECGRRVLLLGDRAAAPFVAQMRDHGGAAWRDGIPGGPGVVDLVGRTELPAAAALLKAGEVFVGNDSGLMHLAAALGRPTVGLFGSSDPDWTAPRGPWVRVVAAEGFPCRPCFRKTCDRPVFCLDTIAAAPVLALASSLVASAQAVKP